MNTRSHPQRAILLVTLCLTACGSGSDGDAPAPPPEPPAAGGTGPITAPAGVWSFVPVEGARCADGSATGIGVRPVAGSREVFIYFEGGGACSTAETCWGPKPGADNLTGYGAADFAAEDKLRNYRYLDISTGTPNPFARMNLVMLPYCTGDGHGGRQVQTLSLNAQSHATHFVGALNVERALQRLAATWPALDAVWVLGTSAGGGGATLNYAAIRQALGAQVHLITDSAPGFTEPEDAAKWAFWGLQPPCPGCTTLGDIRSYNRGLDPQARQAFLSFRFDVTTANGRSAAVFDAELQALMAELRSHPQTRTLLVDNSATGFGPPVAHVVTTKNTPAWVAAGHLSFLQAMVAGSGWQSTTVLPP